MKIQLKKKLLIQILKHYCAHELCEKNPWINKILRPYYSHSHIKEFWEDEENLKNHEGWDHPTRCIIKN